MSGKRIAAASACLVGLALGTGSLVAWRNLAPYAEIGSVYMAQQMCACLYVVGHSRAMCEQEFSPDLARFRVKIEAHAVETRLLTGYGRSEYEPASGCRIVH